MTENKSKPHILNNLGMKLMALLFAAVLWIVVSNINDPIATKRIANVQVKLQHTSLITDQGQVYTVLDNTDVVPVVTVRARRSILDDLTRDDIVATADIENLTSLNTVEIKYSSNRNSSEIESIDGSLENVMLSIEEKMTDSFSLQTETSGEPASGYEVGTVTPEQNQIRVSGPESVVSSIASAKAVVDVSGATSSITTYADVRLVDAEGNNVDTTNLNMNITSVKVNVAILPLKTVPIEVSVSGEPAAGYLRNGVVTVDPETVKLAGKATVLTEIEKIQIPASAVDISGCTSSYQAGIDIRDYLPEGVSLADTQSDGTVRITVGIEQAETSTVSVNVSEVQLENVPDGYRAEVYSINDGTGSGSVYSNTGSFTVSVTGITSAVDAIKAADLTATVDVGELIGDTEETDFDGRYSGQVKVTAPEGVEVNNTVTATVEVMPEAAEHKTGQSQTQQEQTKN